MTLAERRAIVLGNGPSLRGFDFHRMDGFDVFGMNAAYRYWHEIDWYPTYYSCLDLVVGLSHRDAIKHLIENSNKNGIRFFLLRNNLIRVLGKIENMHKVINFDKVRHGHYLMTAPTITTGSQTLSWAVMLGYKTVYLLGIDCNYVEIVPGAIHRKGTELEIVEEQENPNYFFNGYQRKGDKYNIPNPNENYDLHLNSWRKISALIDGTDVTVLNANLKSKVDVFDFCSFESVEHGLPFEIIDKADVLNEQLRDYLCSGGIIGDYKRDRSAHIDETSLVFHLFDEHNNKILLDIGAHYGGSALPFAEKKWLVYCFEPDPRNRSKLESRFRNSKNVVIDSRAVSEVCGEDVAFFSSEESTGISSLLAFSDSHKESATVNVTTIHEIVNEYGITCVDFLKIDAEGYDLFILKGIPWHQLRPSIIECEFEDAKIQQLGYAWDDACEFLVEKGYTVYISEWHPVVRYGIRHDWLGLKRYPSKLESPDAWGNLLAFKNDPGGLAIREALQKTLTVGHSPMKGRRFIIRCIRFLKNRLTFLFPD